MSKTQLKERCRRILGRGPHLVGQDDHVFLMSDVFPRHESWAVKRGLGVSHIEVRRHGAFGSPGFILTRVDGSEVDISYKVALDGKGTVYSRFVAAARTEIQPQAHQWRMENEPQSDGMHVDHVVPFDRLLRDWLALVDLNPEDVAVTSQLVGHTDCFLDRSAAISWQRFHAKRARFQWLTADDNSAKSNTEPADDWLSGYVREEARLAR